MGIKIEEVEKKFSWSVYDITLEIDQVCEYVFRRNHLKIIYRVATTSTHSLSAFLDKIKIESIEMYKRHFFVDIPHHTIITIDKVDPTEYTIGESIDSGALFVLKCDQYFDCNSYIKSNHDSIDYHDNI